VAAAVSARPRRVARSKRLYCSGREPGTSHSCQRRPVASVGEGTGRRNYCRVHLRAYWKRHPLPRDPEPVKDIVPRVMAAIARRQA
jgi:hypothetical protein